MINNPQLMQSDLIKNVAKLALKSLPKFELKKALATIPEYDFDK